MIKAVIFDLFETLVTEWGHEKYTKRNMCKDLNIDFDSFNLYWRKNEYNRYNGKIDFQDSIRYVCNKCGIMADDLLLNHMLNKRMRTKAECFRLVQPGVVDMMDTLRQSGIKLSLLSNCSSEEVTVIRQSILFPYFDEVILSYEAGVSKPDKKIYQIALGKLNLAPDECLYVGDGGNNELEGAANAGIPAVQAKWYTNCYPNPRESKKEFMIAEQPADIIKLLGL